MDVENHDPSSTSELINEICSSFPALDPNGQPFSMVLRGAVAGLGELRSAIARPDARRWLELELSRADDSGDVGGDRFADVDEVAQDEHEAPSDAINYSISQRQEEKNEAVGNENEIGAENKKRGRGDEPDVDEPCDDGDYDDDIQEELLFYYPSTRCTCSSWNMKDVPGDLFVTSLRVLFLSAAEDDDVAIDGSCIALHAVDSLPGGDNEAVSHHVYCQLVDPAMGDEGDMGGYTSAISMIVPTHGTEENVESTDGKQDDEVAEDDDYDTIELYFQPTIDAEQKGSEEQCTMCQNIFDSLTTLASLNPVSGDDGGFNGGGGLFSMLSMMAGIEGGAGGNGMVIAGQQDDNDDDDMVVRLGDSNNLVENDDDSSEGAPEGERQAMLQRLDDMLVVPPQYEIDSSDEGQFDDADEDDEDDAIL